MGKKYSSCLMVDIQHLLVQFLIRSPGLTHDPVSFIEGEFHPSIKTVFPSCISTLRLESVPAAGKRESSAYAWLSPFTSMRFPITA